MSRVALSLYSIAGFENVFRYLGLSVGELRCGFSQTSQLPPSPTTITNHIHIHNHTRTTNKKRPIPDRFTSTVSLTSLSFYNVPICTLLLSAASSRVVWIMGDINTNVYIHRLTLTVSCADSSYHDCFYRMFANLCKFTVTRNRKDNCV